MVPLGDQVRVAPDAPMDQVMGKLEDSQAGRVLVVDDGEMVGIITPRTWPRWLGRWRAVKNRPRRAGDSGRREDRVRDLAYQVAAQLVD
jgi:hypothetical protein